MPITIACAYQFCMALGLNAYEQEDYISKTMVYVALYKIRNIVFCANLVAKRRYKNTGSLHQRADLRYINWALNYYLVY